MKKLLLAVGIALLAVCVLSLLFAAFNLFAHRNVLDGSPALYDRLHRRMIIFAVLGAVSAVLGAVSLVVRKVLFPGAISR